MQNGVEYNLAREILQRVRTAWRRFRKVHTALLGLGIVAFFAILALFPEVFSTYSPMSIAFASLLPPSSTHFFGTDTIGRDVYSRIVWGSQVSMTFGLLAAGISMAIGVPLGLIAGYFGGWVDHALSRVFEIVLMIPAFFLLVMVVAIYGNNLQFEIIVVGITIWPANARIMRTSVYSLKERKFVRAAISTGARESRVVLRHILPNAIQPVITNTNLQIGQAILFEAGMAFLGLSDPNVISWGEMVNLGVYHLADAWWLAFFPGVALTALILGFNLMGDGIAAIFGLERPSIVGGTRRSSR
ncbi:MAG: ABC transporter permease [Thermoplasmata archaeon]